MASHKISFRIDPIMFERLDALGRSLGSTRSPVARTLVEEGLRMETHPGIVFRSGPAGRRPSLASGPDVWEMARVLGNVDASGEDAIRQTAELTGLTLEHIRTVARYFCRVQVRSRRVVAARGRGRSAGRSQLAADS
jgi:hypothetical protein